MSTGIRLTLLIVAAVLASGSLASAGGTLVRYEGQVQDGKGEVELKRASGSEVVDITVRHIRLTCDDGSSQQTSIHRVSARVRNNGSFYTDGMIPDRTGGIYMWTFQGRLAGKAASGKLLYIYNQGPVQEGFADCSTDAELPWSATRE